MPANLIKDGKIHENPWQLITDSEAQLPEGQVIVPLSMWQTNKERLRAREGELGLWLDSDEDPEEIAQDLTYFPVIAVNFPVFTDGRGFSIARLLRERYGYQGELRAVGDVLQDQLFYMYRCGFDSFVLREDKNPKSALANLKPFTHVYQAGADNPNPAYRNDSFSG